MNGERYSFSNGKNQQYIFLSRETLTRCTIKLKWHPTQPTVQIHRTIDIIVCFAYNTIYQFILQITFCFFCYLLVFFILHRVHNNQQNNKTKQKIVHAVEEEIEGKMIEVNKFRGKNANEK